MRRWVGIYSGRATTINLPRVLRRLNKGRSTGQQSRRLRSRSCETTLVMPSTAMFARVQFVTVKFCKNAGQLLTE